MKLQIVVEQHPDGFVAYPLGITGVVVGEGDTAEEALSDVRSAIHFHVDTFGSEVLFEEVDLLDAFLAQEAIEIG